MRSTPHTLAIDRVIDGFELGVCIHSGAMGDLYLVKAPEAAFPLVMKLPRVTGGDAGEGLLAFETEAMILPSLSGRHVPRFFAAGDLARTPYIVMEWVKGRVLQQKMAQEGALALEEVGLIGASIADALHSLHSQQAIHLDVKPDNVILREDGSAVLVDFGLAHHAHFPDLMAEEMRFAAGSTPYVSPEQLYDTRSDPRSDLFSLGVVLYEMATGDLPFGLPQTLKGMRDRLWLDPVPPRQRRPSLPAPLQEVILRCLEPRAQDRYQSASHVAFDLRHPGQVRLTSRSTKMRQAGLASQARRWWSAQRASHVRLEPPKIRAGASPVIMVAVDTTHMDDHRQAAIRRATAQVLSLSEEFRLICVAVIGAELAPGVAPEGTALADPHLEHRVRLMNWVSPLKLPSNRLSLHVMEAVRPEGMLLEFARTNNVDLIIIGAPGQDQHALAWWRSVASGVTAGAHCSVHVVRAA